MKITDWIISETENWVAVNKPSGLLSIPDREGKEISLKVLLKEKYGNIFTVHRIDRDTSGLIVGKPILISALKKKYKLSKDELEERPILGRLALHAFQLVFKDVDGTMIELEAPHHKDMRATLQQLAKRKSK